MIIKSKMIKQNHNNNSKIWFYSIVLILGLSILSHSQGLPQFGNAKLLIIYSDVKSSKGFAFDKSELSEKLKDFYTQMSLGKLTLDITSVSIDIEKPEMFANYNEAVLFLMEKAEEKLDLEEFSSYGDKSVLDGICIIFDNFYDGWQNNPAWSGIATIAIDNQARKFDNKTLQKSAEPGKSSGIIMRSSNGLSYSFWVLAHEVGHLLGLEHKPQNEQIPYYQLMNTTGAMWGINRGMAFWEREALGWVEPNIKLDLTEYTRGKDSTSFYLKDYMSTGDYAKIILPKNEYYHYGEPKYKNDEEFYLENRQKISPYDQEKNNGDEGIFFWRGIGKLMPADGKKDFSQYPTNDAYGAPNFFSNEYEFVHYYSRISSYNPDEGYYLQKYSIPIKMKVAYDNRITIIYGPNKSGEKEYHPTGRDRSPKVKRHKNYPNPFNSNTKISFFLAMNSKISLEIYNIAGEKVKVLADDYLEAGDHIFNFDASDLPSGIYIYRIMTPSGTISRPKQEIFTGKMLYIK